MTGTLRNLLVACGMLMVASPVLACSAARDIFNNPMISRQDCSFDNVDSASGPFGRDQLSGDASVDLGNGQVSQKVVFGDACRAVEWLVIQDCSNGDAIALRGTSDSFIDGAPNYDHVENIQPPHGPIMADGSSSVATLAKEAAESDIVFELMNAGNRDPNGHSSFGFWKKYPSRCGCKLFYPDSEGAKQKL